MAFNLTHVRPATRHSLWPWMILCSESHHFQEAKNHEDACTYITNSSRNTDTPYLVVFFNEDSLPQSAFKVVRGVWRDLDLKIVAPLPADLSALNLYTGSGSGRSPYLVTRW